jgi:hypothetical protein
LNCRKSSCCWVRLDRRQYARSHPHEVPNMPSAWSMAKRRRQWSRMTHRVMFMGVGIPTPSFVVPPASVYRRPVSSYRRHVPVPLASIADTIGGKCRGKGTARLFPADGCLFLQECVHPLSPHRVTLNGGLERSHLTARQPMESTGRPLHATSLLGGSVASYPPDVVGAGRGRRLPGVLVS